MLLTVEPVIAQSTKVAEVEQPLQIAQTSEPPIPLIPDPEIIIQDNPRFAGQDNPQPAVGATPPIYPELLLHQWEIYLFLTSLQLLTFWIWEP